MSKALTGKEFEFASYTFGEIELFISNDESEVILTKGHKLLSLDESGNIAFYNDAGVDGCSIIQLDEGNVLSYDFVDQNQKVIGTVFDGNRDGVADMKMRLDQETVHVQIDGSWYQVIKHQGVSVVDYNGVLHKLNASSFTYSVGEKL